MTCLPALAPDVLAGRSAARECLFQNGNIGWRPCITTIESGIVYKHDQCTFSLAM